VSDKLDFSNALNCNGCDLILETFSPDQTPEIYCLVHFAYFPEPILAFDDWEILSREGAQ